MNKLTQHERIMMILGDYEWHGRSEFIYTHFLPKHDSRISELISRRHQDIEKQERDNNGRQEMHYRLKHKESQQSFMPLSHTFNL